MMAVSVHLFMLLVASFGGGAAHPCDTEVSSACPDRPPSEVGSCLKTPGEHEAPTTLSSECTDFIALNSACSDEVHKFCDDSYFSDDTILCLKTWVEPDSLSSKCTNVMKWAIPQTEEEPEVVTDELGLSEKDYEEKKEWQKKRKAVREEAIGRMKMKEEDRKKEEDRVALEKFKEEDPEGYRQMLEQQAETKRQEIEQKKRERQLAAAMERKKKIEKGEDPAADASSQKGKKSGSSANAKKESKSSFVSAMLCFLAIGGVFVGFFYFARAMGVMKPSSSGKSKGGKKKR